MKTKFFLLATLIIVALAALSLQYKSPAQQTEFKTLPAMANTNNYQKEWEKVDSLIGQGLPKSALELVNAIQLSAEREGNIPQYLKASIYQLKLRSEFEENYIENYIGETEKNLSQKPQPVKQILHSILAELYWQYFEQNMFRIIDQTIVIGNDSKDLATWDALKFTERVSWHYQMSLENAETLQSVSLKMFDPIIQTSEGSKKFRPTLYDFLVHRAVDFLTNETPDLPRPVNEFVMDQSFMLMVPDIFARTPIVSADSLSFKFQALRMLQKAELFHLNDKDPVALVDAVLKRLEYVYRTGNIAEADSIYLKTLIALEEKYKDHPVSTDVIEKIARFWLNPNDGLSVRKSINPADLANYVTARQWCIKAIERFPESDGAANCRVILQSIEEPALSFEMARENEPGKEFPVLLNFRNVKQVWLRLVRLDYDQDKDLLQDLYNRGADRLLKDKPLHEWNTILPETSDYKQHSAELIIPANDPGLYVLILSANEKFDRKASPIAIKEYWATNISLINKSEQDGSGSFYVLHRSSGKPLPGVAVKTFTREYDYRSRKYLLKDAGSYTTGNDGSFKVLSTEDAGYSTLSFDFSTKTDRFVVDNYFSVYRNQPYQNQGKEKTYFFTDRAIYRPGQVVYFKGIVTTGIDREQKIAVGVKSSILLYNVNGEKIAEKEVITNKYGSFSGNFVLPASGLGGMFRIENSSGSVYFNVEEYKRPKFEVRFLPITGSYKLNEKVTVEARAESYTGMPVTDGAVKYRVVRSVHYPFFRYGMGYWPVYVPESEIANGSLTTASDGSFVIEFEAKPDPGVKLATDPVFSYTIYADVTDINGETRSSSAQVQVSNKALLLDINLPEVINLDKSEKFTLSATNLNGKTTPAEVLVEIYQLLPDSRLTRPRYWSSPDLAVYSKDEFVKRLPADLFLNEATVKKGKQVFSQKFNTRTDSVFDLNSIKNHEAGKYLVSLSAKDVYGETVIKEKEYTLVVPAAKKTPVNEPLWTYLPERNVKPGEKIALIVGSAARDARILIEVFASGNIISSQWLTLNQEQRKLEFAIPGDITGNVVFTANMIYNNRSYSLRHNANIRDNRNELNITFESFRSSLLPGGTEKWKIKVSDPDGNPLDAELLAGMYDASLDAFAANSWYFELLRKEFWHAGWQNNFGSISGYSLPWERGEQAMGVSRSYDQLNWFGYYPGGGRFYRSKMLRAGAMEMDAMPELSSAAGINEGMLPPPAPGDAAVAADLAIIEDSVEFNELTRQKSQAQPSVRKNLQETAFFYPHLSSDNNGEIWIEFTVPEALTRWNFMGLAHTPSLRNGSFTKEVVTSKDLMVAPNLPRFFREGDKMVLQSRISNLSGNPLQGIARLELIDAITQKPVDAEFQNMEGIKAFDIETGKNAMVEWAVEVPAGLDAVMVRIMAQSGNHSDGEEVMLPVLTNRMLVTETLPLPVNGNETRTFNFKGLADLNAQNSTLLPHKLTLEFTSNPAWYAVQALPYLAESNHENADVVFNRLYANTLASHIANSNPKIKAVFETWKNQSPEALLSNLEKNQELKNLILEETPWLMEARNESEQKRRIALLFDLNRLASEKDAAKLKIQQLQSANGGWPWFEGMPESRYITQLIVTGFGKLHYLKVDDIQSDNNTLQLVRQATGYLSNRLAEDYQLLKKNHPDFEKNNHLSYDAIQFLLSMSYLQGLAEPDRKAREAIEYYGKQALKYWTSQNLYGQAMIALWAGRSGDMKTATSIMKSLREKSVSHPELGMYWRDNTGGYFWYQAPVETQSLIIELFEELGKDPRTTDQMKTWLLKQKQTQSWATSRATADAVYALLLRGGDWLQTGVNVSITMGQQEIFAGTSDLKAEAGTGYFKKIWTGGEITSDMSNIKVTKTSEGPGWGALYWQYFENLDKITAHDSPLSIRKKLFIKTNSDAGPLLSEITPENQLKVGQQIIVRVELRTDRDLEYVHLKDMRAAGFEPVNTLSGYRWKGGLGYYENTRDASSNFFFSWLPKGTWVFEYPLVVSQKGTFSNGISTVQCMYAPEFAAHSEGLKVIVD